MRVDGRANKDDTKTGIKVIQILQLVWKFSAGADQVNSARKKVFQDCEKYRQLE